MIIPLLRGLVHWRNAPVTWTIIIMNIFVLLASDTFANRATQDLDSLMDNSYYIDTQGRAYAQFVSDNRVAYPAFLRELADHVLEGDSSRLSLLGQLAFRDQEFIKAARELSFKGDQVAFRYWKSKLNWAENVQQVHPSFMLGLNADDISLTKWVTYIFVHSGWVHLIGNMLFFAIFGAVLEAQIGGLALLVIFVLSGVVGAGVFAMMTGVTTSPLVGASGAVSGVMAMFCFLNWRQPMRYMYWLFLPIRGYMGFVYLPVWISFLMWLCADLSGYLSAVPELGGVAHTAHIGGEIAGLLAGLCVFLCRRYLVKGRGEIPAPHAQTVEMYVLHPFLPPLPPVSRLPVVASSRPS